MAVCRKNLVLLFQSEIIALARYFPISHTAKCVASLRFGGGPPPQPTYHDSIAVQQNVLFGGSSAVSCDLVPTFNALL